ncbi:MAG: hypothetical protein LLG14_00310 [Nocardiaceae bacterium]|nr:hypothetical protein [Nocardiaceae bacterium]
MAASDTERADTEKSDTEKSETERSDAESWERAFGDKPDVDESSVDKRNDDKTHVDETRDEQDETRDEKVEPLGWHHGVSGSPDRRGNGTGRHRETGETENDEEPHKNLWQRVVSAVEQRRHD